MQFDIIGAMPARYMLSMFKREPLADLQFIDTYGLDVTNYSYSKSGVAANLLRQNDKGEVTVFYKVLGETSLGVQLSTIRAMLRRNTNVLIFHKGSKHIYSAIAYSDLDMDVVEGLCKKISESLRPRDTQRKRVYQFCDFVTPHLDRINEAKAVELVKRVIADYGIPKDRVQFYNDMESSRNDGVCYSIPFDTLETVPAMNVINIRMGRGNLMYRDTLLHELAHMVVRYEYANDSAIGHGPAFVALYIELLAKYGFDNPLYSQRIMVKHHLEHAARYKVKVDAHCILIDDGWYTPSKPRKLRR